MRPLILAVLLGPPLAAQTTSVADTVMKLNRAGRSAAASQLAGPAIAQLKGEERCAVLVGGAWSLLGIGRPARAEAVIRIIDSECPGSPAVQGQSKDLADLRRAVVRSPLPSGGVDFSAVDRFWEVADTLARDIEPSLALWRRMLDAPGYQIASISTAPIQHLMEIALRPSRKAERDSIIRARAPETAYLLHFARVIEKRAELTRYRNALGRGIADTVPAARSAAARFLPGGAAPASTPLIAFALFTDDGFSEAPGIIIDLLNADENGLTPLLAHELHHFYASPLSPELEPAGGNDGRLYHALRQLRNEGIADLVNKPYPFVASPRSATMGSYAARYNQAYERTPLILAQLDSLLAGVADDPATAGAAGNRARELLIAGSHPNGAFMARRILETFGVDSLMPGLRNPFAFIRTYTWAESKRGNPPPFSPKGVAALDALERRYKP